MTNCLPAFTPRRQDARTFIVAGIAALMILFANPARVCSQQKVYYYPGAQVCHVKIVKPMGLEAVYPVADEGDIVLSADPGTDLIANLQRDARALSDQYLFVTRQGDQFTVKFRLPQPGIFNLIIFARPAADTKGEYASAVLIPVDGQGTDAPVVLYPRTYRDFHRLTVLPAEAYPGVLSTEAEVQMKFLCPDNITVLATLGNEKEKSIPNSVSIKPESGGFVVKTTPPHAGAYTLSISAHEKQSTATPFKVILRYEIDRKTEPASRKVYPGFLLPGDKYIDVQPAEDYPGTLTSEGEVKLNFVCSHDLLLYAILWNDQHQTEQEATLIQPTQDGYSLKVAPPAVGTFTLDISTKEKTDVDGTFTDILEYQIVQKEEPKEKIFYPVYLTPEGKYIIDYELTDIAHESPVRDYAAIDSAALATPKSKEASVDALVEYLTGPAHDEVEKARAFYVWIANNISYAVDAYFSGEKSKDVTEWDGVLASRKGICAGYVSLFNEMCDKAGIKYASIEGTAKGYGYQETDDATPNHSWNAVELEGKWYLIDVTWGSGHLEKKLFKKKFEEKYFLTPPEIMICNHFPQAKKWQFLDHQVTFEEFKLQKCK